jgi:thymidylate synthase ThyX
MGGTDDMTIRAEVIADSVSPHGVRLTTLQLRYPKFIHGEFMTHRVFSRNASSSRAIPVERLIKDVINDPVYPSFWGKDQPGMSAREEHNEFLHTVEKSREDAWDYARKQAITMAQAFAKAGYHKQIINRLLEPFCHINVVVTATEWTNFFALRCHKDAQPEMRELAEAMRSAITRSAPDRILYDHWHTPYVDSHDFNWTDEDDIKRAVKCSVARCARVSYLTQDSKIPSVEDDLKLYDRLVGSVPLHASPAEHQATPDEWVDLVDLKAFPGWRHPELHGNFRGWIQYRKTLPEENQ